MTESWSKKKQLQMQASCNLETVGLKNYLIAF